MYTTKNITGQNPVTACEQAPTTKSMMDEAKRRAAKHTDWHVDVSPELFENSGAEKFPIECLPQLERDAVLEVARDGSIAIELLQSQTLAAISAVGAICSNVRSNREPCPACVNVLTIAGSSEGKSTAFKKLFSRVINEVINRKAEALKDDRKAYREDTEIYEATRKRIQSDLTKVKVEEQKGKLRSELYNLELPIPPPEWNRLCTSSRFSIEGIMNGLAQFPVNIIASDEGLSITGSHAFKKDQIHDTMGYVNSLYSGTQQTSALVSSGAKSVDPRGMANLMIQPKSFKASFMDERGDIAKDSGMAARFLTSRPPSKAGTVKYTEECRSEYPCIDRFCKTLIEIAIKANTIRYDEIKERYVIEPPVIDCSPEAITLLTDYLNKIEPWKRDRYSGDGEIEAVSKSAENALRIAALGHMIENPDNYAKLPISQETMRNAITRAEWFLHEGIRAINSIDVDTKESLPQKYERAIYQACEKDGTLEVTSTQVDHFASNRSRKLRIAEERRKALKTLEEMGRAFSYKEGKTTYIKLHPIVFKEYQSAHSAQPILGVQDIKPA